MGGFVEEAIVSSEPEYSDDEYKGNQSLNVTETSDLGAVLLDAHPISKKYTLSFAIKKNIDSTNDHSRLSGTENSDTNKAEIMYIGDSNISGKDYYTIRRITTKDDRHLRLFNQNSDNTVAIKNIFQPDNKDIVWSYMTFVFDEGKLYVYTNGEKAIDSDGKEIEERDLTKLETNDINIIIAGLQEEYTGSDILIDDLYVYDTALSEDQVRAAYTAASGSATSTAGKKDCGKYHATTTEGQDLAQISERVANNPYDSQRRGWYYVNSHSEWKDIAGCLQSGKQFVGIWTDEGIATYPNMAKDIATIPSGVNDPSNEEYQSIKGGDKQHADYVAPPTERSLRFYVDKNSHLRCFVWSGSDTKEEGDERTFCSLVYEKEPYSEDGTARKGQPTKYERLNDALNQFYTALAENSDLTNSAIVRFSTINAIDADTDTTEENLKKLIMKDWTNWSDAYTKESITEKDQYLHNLLIPDEGETSTSTTKSKARPDDVLEYPYVMTGGTYTWTGLKAFYDNMVNIKGGDIINPADDLTSGNKVYDIANDARDKYLIIFTDGRDNTVGKSDEKYSYEKTSDGPHKSSVGNFAPYDDATGKQKQLENDSELAEAWADKLKEEGYTIYCVMMATGSISPTANKTEYDKAYEFLKTLAGKEKEDSGKKPEDYVIVADPTSKTGNTTVNAFQQILTQIQQPRKDYTVQDYIDPRFNLVDINDNVYELGADGKITVTKEGKEISEILLSDGSKFVNGTQVGNVIDDGEEALGLAYTPRDSFMVNRKESKDKETYPKGYDNGDGKGTGYIYYDDEKDMYYLRWTDQIIPMENEAFDTDTSKSDTKYLDVWSATIRLKAKDDFIGGNNILTNGNEAGENLVYSDATIENMDKGDNYKLYGFVDSDRVDGKIPYRKKLEALSGTNRKINAVDAGGVSQAVYGNGIDIPSSGFPRVVVDVRLKPLDAKDLNDVIYMGEVISPTMMLADLENGYMTGSYYLEYLARYAYRLYGYEAAKTPLLDLLNQWLKINEEEVAEKTFTIPYMYLPEPIYNDDGTLELIDRNVVAVKNSTGMSTIPSGDYIIADFEDLNLCDVTGFITYTWKREDPQEEQQDMRTVDSEGKEQYDITKEYVVKNTNQIKYNLQLKFTPLKDKELTGFTLDDHFIKADSAGKGGEKFFDIVDKEFNDTGVLEWSIGDARTEYLEAMVHEEQSYEPHVMYDGSKWVLVDNNKLGYTQKDAVDKYSLDEQTTANADGKTVTDKGVYDWDSAYKEAAGTEQIENRNINDYYTGTPKNVQLVDAAGNAITDETGKIKEGSAPCSIVANTTYVKDVVNGALALELVVDGKYLGSDLPITKSDKTYTFEATRYYDDPIDPLPYGEGKGMSADTDIVGKKYQLTFKVDPDSIPSAPESDVLYTVWANLSKVEEFDITESKYKEITNFGYKDIDALPIGTYVISVDDTALGNDQYYIGVNGGRNVYFKYLKLDNTSSSYTFNRFPESVHNVSSNAATDTSDNEYLIKNDDVDYAPKNIADCSRKKDSAAGTQELTFYFGTVENKEVNGKTLTNTKGENRIENREKDYAKDRLGIIMLSVDPNSLAISKKVTNTKAGEHDNDIWTFNIDFTLNDDEAEFETNNTKGFPLTWYTLDSSGDWVVNTPTPADHDTTISFTDAGDGKYTATITLKHGEKVVINGLPEGTWQVTEADNPDLFYSPHNNAHGLGDGEWEYERAEATSPDIQLNPASHVDFVNEFPYELPSAGGIGVDRFIFFGTAATVAVALTAASSYYKRRKRRRIN